MATGSVCLNDKHSRLNPIRVAEVVPIAGIDDVCRAVAAAGANGRAVCIGGGRHAMGGQQFAEGAVYLDMLGLGRILHLDTERGLCEVEAGIEWPELIDGLSACSAARQIRGRSRKSRPARTRWRSAARWRRTSTGAACG